MQRQPTDPIAGTVLNFVVAAHVRSESTEGQDSHFTIGVPQFTDLDKAKS